MIFNCPICKNDGSSKYHEVLGVYYCKCTFISFIMSQGTTTLLLRCHENGFDKRLTIDFSKSGDFIVKYGDHTSSDSHPLARFSFCKNVKIKYYKICNINNIYEMFVKNKLTEMVLDT